MKDQGVGRREFLKGAAVAGAASVASAPAILPEPAQAQQAAAAAPTAAGYSFLNLEEAAFVETLVDHMVPADELSPKGTDIGINTYIDRALSSAWGKGDRLYMQGPWKVGVPSQGYQLPLTPAQLYRAGIEATNEHCRKTYGGRTFDRLTEAQREEVLQGLSSAHDHVRQRPRRARVLDHGLSERDGRHVLRPDLWRQSQQGGLEADRLPRRHRRASRECREISRQGIPQQSARHRGYELGERQHGHETQGS